MIDARLDALADDLRTLDAEADRLMERVEGVLIATLHRYQCLARAYDLDIRYLEWVAGAAPNAAQIAELDALAKETGSRILIREAPVPQEARDAVRELGLKDVVFPPLARLPTGRRYTDTFRTSMVRLTEIISETLE